MADDFDERFSEATEEYPAETAALVEIADNATSYGVRTNAAVVAVFGGHMLIFPPTLHAAVAGEVLRSSLFLLSQAELLDAMVGDPGDWVSPVDLFARGYIMGFGLVACLDAQPADALWEEYEMAKAGDRERDMGWLHEMVEERVPLFLDAMHSNPDAQPADSDKEAQVARAIEARVGTMFLMSKDDAREMAPIWWQCLVDGAAKGATGFFGLGLGMPRTGQESFVRRYARITRLADPTEFVAQKTVTKTYREL